jgi:outer membrane receptor protein involved in Fe transport
MTGTVVSRQDGRPVANAAVVVEGTSLTAVTNAAGRFRIENAPAARSTVVVKAPGFLDGRVTDVLAGSGQGPLIVELDPYSIVDAAVTWRRGPLRVTLSGHNLFNDEYYWNGGSETVDPGRPRQVLVSFSVLAR